jgi:UDP-glucose 4-epimerase
MTKARVLTALGVRLQAGEQLTPRSRSRSNVGVPRSVVVVGGGFIGSHVARGFVIQGVPTTVVTRKEPKGVTAERLSGSRLVVADAGDTEAMRPVVDLADHIVWCAGGLLPAESNERPGDDLVSALLPLLRTLDLLTARGEGSLTLISSGGTVYGNPAVLPVPEHCLPRPLTSHGITKVSCELYLSLYRDLHGFRTLALRCGNVYGEGQLPNRSQGLVANALNRALHGEPILVFGDGGAVRDYIHVDDVVDVVCTLAGRLDAPEVVNVGTGLGTTVTELLMLVERVTRRHLVLERRPSRAGDVRAVVLDTTLLQSLMVFAPLPLEDGLAHTWSVLVEACGAADL